MLHLTVDMTPTVIDRRSGMVDPTLGSKSRRFQRYGSHAAFGMTREDTQQPYDPGIET